MLRFEGEARERIGMEEWEVGVGIPVGRTSVRLERQVWGLGVAVVVSLG